jgi:hypothetical protein
MQNTAKYNMLKQYFDTVFSLAAIWVVNINKKCRYPPMACVIFG